MNLGVNTVPGRYRGVAVVRHGAPPSSWDEASLRERYLGRDAYWATRFLVVLPPGPVTDGTPAALLAVDRETQRSGEHADGGSTPIGGARPAEAARDETLFRPITAVDLVAGPDDAALLVRPELDTAIPSALARAARDVPGARAVVVLGRYEHVNFVVDADPLRVRVREVVPPHPAKLVDQARRVMAVTETLRPVALEPEVVELAALAARRPAEHYLLPCRGGGGEVPGATLSYLDEHPEAGDWTQLGCERSRRIHRWFYGRDAPRVDFCPKLDPAAGGPGPLLTKCCLQQEELDEGICEGPDGPTRWVSVPWGSSLDHVREALLRIAAREEPAWEPA